MIWKDSDEEIFERAVKRAYGIPARERRRRWLWRIYVVVVVVLLLASVLLYYGAFR